MIVKFHARGKGGGSGPVDYLLGPGRDREGAMVLRGNPEEVRELIDATPFAKKYTSGVLSFAEKTLPTGGREKVMESFERVLMPGLEKNQYSVLWVEHQDKGRLELNFVIPNMELQTGKRLQPYYDRADRPRIDAWQTLVNHHYGLHDPNAPENRRTLATPGNLPETKQKAAEAITAGLEQLCLSGSIQNRQDVIQALTEAGFNVVRTTRNSISIADPDGGRNLRLKGAIYEQSFENGDGLSGAIESAAAAYRRDAESRVQRAREFCKIGTERKREENQIRYQRSRERDDGGHGVEPAERAENGRTDVADHHDGVRPAARHEREHSVVAGAEDAQQLQDAFRAEGKHGETEREDMGSTLSGDQRRSPVPDCPEGHTTRRLPLQRDKVDSAETGITENDGAGKTIAERVRAATAELCAAAERLGERLRGIAADVYAYATGERAAERAGYSVESASKDIVRAGDAAERADRKTEQAIRHEEVIRRVPQRIKTLGEREYGD